MNKFIIPIIVIVILVAAGAFLVFKKHTLLQPPILPQPIVPPTNKCPQPMPLSLMLKEQCRKEDGKIEPKKNEQGCIVDYECKKEISTTTKIIQNSPFGLFDVFASHEQFSKDMKFSNEDYWKWVANHFRNLGSRWSRHNLLFIWGIVEPEIGKGYKWGNDQITHDTDGILKIAYNYGGDGFNMVVVVNPSRSKDKVSIKGNEKNFRKFLRTAVERYDGDGIDDAYPNISVKYWQATNELALDWFGKGGTVDEYVDFLRIFSEEVKSADPRAKIIMGAEIADRSQKLSQNIKAIISKLNGEKVFDVVDIHYWELASQYKMVIAGEMRKYLDDHGYGNVEIWSMEHGTYVNRPNPSKYEPSPSLQTEKEQAMSLIKRFVYNLAHDVDKIFWNNIVEWSCFAEKCGGVFDNMGLISDGRNSGETSASLNVPRLSYYAYKKMVEVLGGSDWKNIQTIQESDGIYIYKFTKQGKPIWVAWNDNSTEKQITISGITSNQAKITKAVPEYETGKGVTDYNTAFSAETKSVANGKIMMSLNDKPVFVEEK